MENAETTQGAKLDGWDKAVSASGTENQEGFIEKEAKSGSVAGDVMKYGARFLQDLESNLPFTVMIVSIAGYIIIASFGQMDNIKKYFGYLLFLMIMFCSYKILKGDFLKTVSDRINKIAVYIITILVVIILIQNLERLIEFVKYLKIIR